MENSSSTPSNFSNTDTKDSSEVCIDPRYQTYDDQERKFMRESRQMIQRIIGATEASA